jgi:fumarate hydratase class II
MTATRKEYDSLGEVAVPADKLWGGRPPTESRK